MKSSCISHPADEALGLIRQWQIEFYDNNQCAAALVSYFEYWHNWKRNTDTVPKNRMILHAMHGDSRHLNEDVYQNHTLQKISDDILNLFGVKSIFEALKLLASKGVISIHANPNPKYAYDRTKYFKFYRTVCKKSDFLILKR